MSVLLIHSFKTAIFSRFLKVAIATSNFMNKVYDGGDSQSFYSFGKIQNVRGPELSEEKI